MQGDGQECKLKENGKMVEFQGKREEDRVSRKTGNGNLKKSVWDGNLRKKSVWENDKKVKYEGGNSNMLRERQRERE